MKIRFISANELKIEEASTILAPSGIEVVAVAMKIEELQTEDVQSLVRDKALKAFAAVGKPLFVEHTGLEIASLNGFPSGLTQIFWDTLKEDRFASFVGGLPDPSAIARTLIGYCDGRTISFFEGKIAGKIANAPAGSRDFQWDCVFIPQGETQTFAELGGARKNEISMRRLALDQLRLALRRNL
jgi:XTP/dITP diphosphohydrolase